MPDQPENRFAALGTPRRVWAVASIHADLPRLTALHDALFDRIRPGDRIVYLGNYTGHGADAVGTIDELLTFRRMVLALPGMMVDDIAYLRGGQEEMWQKLLQITYAAHPLSVLHWILERGMAPTLESYGIDPDEGRRAAAESVVALARWLNRIRDAARGRPGHEQFMHHWRHAAFTQDPATPILFVHSGIDPSVSIEDQGDSFWWAGRNFADIQTPYEPFCRIIRGYDAQHGGLAIGDITVTLDGGCGFGGSLIAGSFAPDGILLEILEA